MSSDEESGNFHSPESELESMVETLQTETPSAPEINGMVKDGDTAEINNNKTIFACCNYFFIKIRLTNVHNIYTFIHNIFIIL